MAINTELEWLIYFIYLFSEVSSIELFRFIMHVQYIRYYIRHLNAEFLNVPAMCGIINTWK